MTEQDIVPVGESTFVAIDSLCANEFALEIDGEVMTGIFRVTGLISFKLDVKTTTAMKLLQEPFKIVKMVQRDGNNAFNKWLRESVAAGDDIVRPKRTVTVVAIDDGAETRRWAVKGAWISEVCYSDFDTASGEMVEEIITLHYDEIEESWPATPDLE
jgi:hypothetical protein